ncbi:DUF1853 family protein [Halotalea alkalilenta]|uniref:DUF1853 family protein n=1 Tax=Halotalea alkalilenta TaxID=376489 RepID=UPI000694CDFB|nr:DUF1853 family protein [Halotalea alkalilenta]
MTLPCDPRLAARAHADLAWLLDAPPLAQPEGTRYPALDALGVLDPSWRRGRAEEAPPFAAWLDERPSRRLGEYVERLWQWLIARAPNAELIAANQVLRADQRTLGELDLLYRRRDAPHRLIHLELAIKFYLGLDPGPGAPDSARRWIGTDGRDSLELKLRHLTEQQTRLLDAPLARAALNQQLGSALAAETAGPIERQCAMLGVLFHPWPNALPAPRDAKPGHLVGRWLHWHQWPAFRTRYAPAYGFRLGMPHALHPPRDAKLLPIDAFERQLAGHFDQGEAPRPLRLALFDLDGEPLMPTIITAQRWPLRVPL